MFLSVLLLFTGKILLLDKNPPVGYAAIAVLDKYIIDCAFHYGDWADWLTLTGIRTGYE